MNLTARQIEDDGILDDLVGFYDNSVSAGGLLRKAEIKKGAFSTFGDPSIKDWWRKVLDKLELGLCGDNSLFRLLQAAADECTGNDKLKPYQLNRSQPDNRNNAGGNIKLTLPETLSIEDICKIMDKAKEIVKETGKDLEMNLAYQNSTHLSLTIPDCNNQEELSLITKRIQEELSNEGFNCDVQIENHNFRDYYTDPLTAEGPDSQRFAIERVRASTRVKDVARGIMSTYSDDIWPSRGGQKTQAVVDKVMDKGQKGNRLNPTDTLHDAGVRPGDTLRVSPERTAGAINPMDRDAALARVRNEVLDFVDAHPGFTAQSNSPVAPTEYLFNFSTKGFAPSHFQDGWPRHINDHEVLLVLPGDFPVQAPEVWWQTDIFHPNIDPKTGFVCLGELQDQYRPALNMGVLCQLLIDLAAYRNYAETDALDMDAARWALSDKGQKAIKDIKGQTIKSRDEKDDIPDQKLRIRKIKS